MKTTNTNALYANIYVMLKHVKGPEKGYVPDFEHKYMTEGIPYNLVVYKGIAEATGVDTPTIDTIIEWAQQILGKQYVVDGKLAGKNVMDTRAPQAYGIMSVMELFDGDGLKTVIVNKEPEEYSRASYGIRVLEEGEINPDRDLDRVSLVAVDF